MNLEIALAPASLCSDLLRWLEIHRQKKVGTPLVVQRVWPVLPDGKRVLTRQKRGEGNDVFDPLLLHFDVPT